MMRYPRGARRRVLRRDKKPISDRVGIHEKKKGHPRELLPHGVAFTGTVYTPDGLLGWRLLDKRGARSLVLVRIFARSGQRSACMELVALPVLSCLVLSCLGGLGCIGRGHQKSRVHFSALYPHRLFETLKSAFKRGLQQRKISREERNEGLQHFTEKCDGASKGFFGN